METRDTPTRAAVTLSFDDGHHADLRVAERLDRHAMKATFYVAFNEPGALQIAPAEIRELHGAGHEIGSHTLSHRVLVTLPPDQIERELIESKSRLEDLLGDEVVSVSYPLGYANRQVLGAARRAGYRLGRTMAAFRIDRSFEPLRMPISVEFFPHPASLLARHALRDLNAAGAFNWLRAGFTADPLRLATALFPAARAAGGLFHVTARSWEIDGDRRWLEFDALLALIGGDAGIDYLTNRASVGTTGDVSAISPAPDA